MFGPRVRVGDASDDQAAERHRRRGAPAGRGGDDPDVVRADDAAQDLAIGQRGGARHVAGAEIALRAGVDAGGGADSVADAVAGPRRGVGDAAAVRRKLDVRGPRGADGRVPHREAVRLAADSDGRDRVGSGERQDVRGDEDRDDQDEPDDEHASTLGRATRAVSRPRGHGRSAYGTACHGTARQSLADIELSGNWPRAGVSGETVTRTSCDSCCRTLEFSIKPGERWGGLRGSRSRWGRACTACSDGRRGCSGHRRGVRLRPLARHPPRGPGPVLHHGRGVLDAAERPLRGGAGARRPHEHLPGRPSGRLGDVDRAARGSGRSAWRRSCRSGSPSTSGWSGIQATWRRSRRPGGRSPC